jgi:hypothetical protein
MTTRDRSETTGVLGSIGRFTLIAAFTGVETVALVVWLALVDDAAVTSETAALGLGILAVGLLVEHFLTDLAVNGIDLSFPLGRAIVFSASEALLWALWLGIADRVGGLRGLAVAAAVLALLLVPQHTVEDNVLRGRSFFDRLLNLDTIGFSIVESVGATVWLLFVRNPDLVEPQLTSVGLTGVDPAAIGVGILALALLVEHDIGVGFSRRG